MMVEKAPAQEMRVYMRAFDRETALESNENRLAPAAGRAQRIEIIVKQGGKGDCMPPGGGAPRTVPPFETVLRTPQPAKETKATQAAVTKATVTKATAARAKGRSTQKRPQKRR